MKVNLTDKFIQCAKLPTLGRDEYYDQKVVGLTLRVTPLGNKSFSVPYRMPGNPKKARIQIGPYPTISLAVAREKALEILRDIRNNINPALKSKTLKQEPFISDLLHEFWERELSKKKSSKDMYRLLVKDVLPSWGNKKVSAITRRDVVILLDKIRDRGAPITANRLHGRLTRLFNFACERGILDQSPMTRLRKTEETPRERVLSDDEISKFWNLIDTVGIHPLTAIALKLMLVTAQRAGEVVNMCWHELDLETKIWTIPAEKSKNGRAHKVPLTPMGIALLQTAKALSVNSEFVFPSPLYSKGMKPIEVRSLSRAICRKHSQMGIDKFVPHDLRRTVRTKLAEIGINEVIAERLLNHHLQGLARVYNHHDYCKEMREALLLWEYKLNSLCDQKNLSRINEMTCASKIKMA